MDLWRMKWTALGFLCFAFIWSSKNWLLQPIQFTEKKDSLDLLIGIVSSRSNFEQREAVRQTWKNDSLFLEKARISAYFVVGEKNCPIPPEDRVDVNVCEKWNVDVEDIEEIVNGSGSAFACEINRLHSPSISNQIIYEGFTVLIHHPIIVNKIGILSNLYEEYQNLTAVLIDAITGAEIASISLSPIRHGILVLGFFYLPIDPIILPKGFEATFVVRFLPMNVFSKELINKWNYPGKFFSYTQLNKQMKNSVVVKHFSSALSATSFAFTLLDSEGLKNQIEYAKQRQVKWSEYLQEENMKIIEETLQYNDIVIVDVVDVYRNLAEKMLLFYRWVTLHSDTHYVMKTDDDTFLNIADVIEGLKELQLDEEPKLWWSSFRYNWLVDRFGKWREVEYTAAVYPPFGCGAGNVLSRDLVIWLASNYKNLHAYQGEDVSLGIWLSALHPFYLDDPRWKCDAGCSENAYNVGQLSSLEMRETWGNFILCENPCGCLE